ncbi:MAG: glycosyltransferase family 39 protein [Epsilonproteobacteria bacterium]|nr:glycosyltransferase family 39 protein [Campylobacterota bacterium]OIO13279.1 MAG: dolichyl-phosphate-mannose--protein mannosyltransferase [Helicobacteraceae bacterium CG1_02_36_14]PIP11031.1 MAG: dolichyl-phosphate-mannose--protein mannosyltransferase [Sulfurimonas sp. CG23_combo_of_CG06-09_8_20_14_all_36_33]PIS25416.1 MAG: dolichyl-phosphate-mannose--protein mannosyltransferase [Sulfurimonas sp. CG08_land_8_20_14_0_20_36_33]PIU36109.1 MAG: dolichyl-phosphate-mannose--protein mannosyltransfe
MNLRTKEHAPFLYFISFVALIRLTLAPFVGLGVDEAHYVLYALHLDLSYFDHPPLVGWVEYIFTSLFGVNEFGARVAAVIIGFVTSLFIYKLIYEINQKSSEAFVAVLALHASFLFNALFLMLMPDTLLFLLLLPIIFTVIQLEKTNSFGMWILLGLLLGLAGLSKYTAVLFVLPILLYFLIKKRYELFFTPKIIPSIFIALLLISPVLLWNIQNDWISFSYQSSHVVGAKQINWGGFLSSIAAQFGAYNPFLFPLAFYGLYRATKSKNDSLFLSALFGWVMIGFFTYASLYKTALPHWSALFYMLFIPIGTFYLIGFKKYLKFAIGFGLLLSSLAYAELGFKFIPLPDYQSLHRDIYGWDTIMQRANGTIQENPNAAIAVTNWTLASRALFYNQPYNSSVYLLDDRKDQFDIWQEGSPLGKDILIINTHFFKKDLSKYMKCERLIPHAKFDIILNERRVNTIDFSTCQNYQGLK